MSDSLTLYRTIADLILSSRIHFHDKRCLKTFLWMVVCALLEKHIHLPKWVPHRVGEAQAASKQRQLARWLTNERIQELALYRPLLKTLFADWRGHTLYLALDSSSLWDRFVIVRLAFVYRGRALPVSWVVLEHGSCSVALATYKKILLEAAQSLPPTCPVVLLADRGFADTALMKQARDLGWGFRIRLKSSFRVHRNGKPSLKLARLLPAKGQALFLHKVWLTDRAFGPVHLALAHVQTAQGFQTWALVSDDPTDLRTFDEYGLRFDLEENFLDEKSGGFQLEASHLRDAAALSRLGLVLATATLYLVSVGTLVVARGWRRLVDPHWQRGLSYFKIGWRWLAYALSHGQKLFAFFWLEPGPDPDLVFASKRQAAQPTLRLDRLEWQSS